MSDFKLRKNPETGQVFFWENGATDWTEVKARRQTETGEVFVLGEQDTEWRNLGVYMDSPPKQRPMAQAPLSPSAPHVTQNNAPQTPQDALVSLIAPQGLPQPAASPNAPQTMQPAAPAPVPMEQPAQQNVLAQPKHGFLPPEQAIIEAMTGAPTAPNASTPFDGEGFGDLAKRRGQQFMRGLTEVPASVPEALAVAGFDNPNAAAAVALEIVQSAQAQIAQAEQRIAEFPNMNAEDRARVNSVISDAQKQIAAYQPLVDAAEGPVKPAAKDRDLFKTGDKVRQASQKTFGAPDPRDTSFWGKLAEGAGNMTGFVATSLLTGPLGAAGTGSALNSSQLYKEAIQEGASEEDARRAAAFGGALGLTEAVPIQRALRVLPPKLRGEVSNKFVRRLIQIGQSGGEEAIQETVVGIGNNLIAQNIYDPERGVLRDVGEQALIGAILGGGVSAVGQSIDAATSGNRKTPPAPDAPEPPEPDTPPDAPRSAPQRPQQPSAEDAILRAMGAGAETQDGGNTEIMGETEIVDGESVPTGRQVRVNLDTGEVTPVEGDTLPSPSASAVPPQQDSTGLRVAPAAPAGGSDPAREGTITTETLSSEEVARVGTDAQTFQYKDNGDEAGVTDRLRGVDNWDERSAMGGIVYEYADGRRVAADGHQRLGLAKRLQERGQQTPWTVEVIREADGFTPADVRRIAALKNIREGSGTAIDAAKVLREAPDEIDSLGLPPNSALVRDAKGLSRLSDDAFGAVVNGVVPEQYGAIVGSTVQDSSLQLDVIGLLNKLKPANARQAEMIAQQAGQSKVTETQTSLFGDEDISQSLYLERAKVLDNALQRIKKDRQTFKVLADRADTITEEGNVLNSTANAKRLETDAEMQAYLQAEANRKGVISDALTQAARRLKDNPSTISGVTNDFLSQIRNVDESVRQRGESADGERSRDEGQPESVDPSPEPAPTDPETDLLALMGAQQDAPATTKDSQKDEIKARQNQSKSRRLDGNTGSAGPLFDGQSDLFDAPTQSAAKRVGVFVDRTPDEKPQGQYKDLRDELPEAIPTDKLAAEAKRLTLEPGQRDGIEYLMMVDGDGQIVAYGSGHKSGTGVAPAFKLLESNDERIGMHHNHPSSNGFSSSDFSIALSPGADVVYAHGHDGSTFKMRATPKGRAAWPVEGLAPRWDAIRQELDRALHNMWRGNRPRISKLIDDGFYPPEQGLRDGNYRQPGRDRTFAFMMAMRDAGLIEIEVTGPAADRFEGKNPFIFDPELKKAYDRLVRGLKKRVPREGVQDDRRATTGRHPAELAGIPERTADVTGSDQRSDVEEDVSGRDPQSEKGDRGEGSQRGRLVDDVMAFRKVKAFSEETIESLTDKNLEAVHWLATNGYTGVALDASRTFAKVPNASHVRIDTIRAAQEGNGFPTPNESGVYNADDVKKGDSAKHFIGHTAKKGWKGVPSMEWAVLQVGDGKWLESASFSVPVSGSFGGLSGTQYFATREAALKKALGHLKKRVEGLIDSSTVPDTSQREAKQILDRVLQDAEAQGIDLSATEIPASDSDEVVSVRVTPEGPWDFNDTWPSPDVMLMAGARAEGRDEFDRGDVEEIVGVLDETMNNLVSELAAQRAWEDQVRKIESGEKPDFKKVKNETPLETAQREIATLERNIDDTLAAVADRWPQDAVDAMRAEAVRRVDQERVTSGKEATQNQPKPTEPDDFDAALDDVFGADLRAGAQSRADQETRKKRSKKAIADDIKGVLRGLEESSAAVRSDDGTYGKLRSLFIEALDGEDIEGKSQRGIFATMMRPLVDAGLTRDDVAKLRPFFTRFMEDVERGNIDLAGGTDAAGSSDSLERNSGDGDAGDRVGGTDVSASGGTDGNSTAAGTDASDGGNRRSTGSSGLPAGDATGVGARGNQSVRGENGTEPGASRDPDGTGSRSDRQSRLPDDKESDQETARHATDSADVDRAKAQAKADRTKVKFNDEQNIRDTLPLLMPEQQDDVVLIERRYASESGHGMLLTNGTGTGKTYSGGGVIKRMVQAGKSDILITAPDDGIMNAWIAMGRDLGIPISPLKDTKDAGEGVVVTTYANMGANKSLAKRDWDLIVTDEAHKLSQNAAGDSTNALKTLRVISNRPSERWARGYMVHADEWANWKDMADGDKKTALGARLRAKNDALKEKYEKQPRSKVLFLSATPFSYDKTLDYAEGYLFDYGSGGTTDSGSRQDGRAFFFVENFGYRIRYHKLTKPEGAVDNAVFEREFHEKLKRDGSLAGRSLTVSTDYDRKFVSTKSDLGDAIDAGMKYLREKQGQKSDPEGGWSKVQQYVNRSFKYHHRMQLLEQIKAEAAVKDIRAHVALGRKVVVFHDFNKGGGINPFRNPVDEGEPGYEQFVQFLTDNPKLANADFAAMRSPLRVMREEFGDQVAFYNGTETKADRRKAIQDFNDESSDIELIVVQADAGSAGISLHDTTGNRQRVLINLGMPPKPTTALQEEGRIRRVGVKTDAPFRYYTIGTTWERMAFADKIAGRSGTVENLALGNEARTIRDSFIDAYAEADVNGPSAEDGKGGMERDRADYTTSEFDRAKTHYYGRMKSTAKRNQRAGADFYATPEPLGYKMVEWAGMRANEKAMEPSVGDGAIGRYFPDYVESTIVDPSLELLSKARLRVTGAKAKNETFEKHHVSNKYDTVVMNPPFGSGGKLAYEHVAKALKHVRPGGRLVALVPTGPAADKQFSKMRDDLDETAEWNWTADVALPRVTFEKAGTNVGARVLIFDRVMDAEKMRPTQRINITGPDDIATFFERLEGIAVTARPAAVGEAGAIADAEGVVDSIKAAGRPAPPTLEGDAVSQFAVFEFQNTKTGETMYGAQVRENLGDRFKAVVAVAKSHNGYYSRYQNKAAGAQRGFLFKSDAERRAFMSDLAKPVVETDQRQPVQELSGDELGRHDTISGLRNAAKDWYKNNLIGTTAQTKEGWEVSFNGPGNRKSTSKGEDLLRLVPAIRSVIEQGDLVESRPGNRNPIRSVHFIAATVVINGDRKRVIVSIRETNSGTFHYELGWDGGVEQAQRSSVDGDPDDKRRFDPVWNQPVPDLNIMLVDEDFNFGQSQAAQEALISALPSLRAELDRLSLKRVNLVIDVPGGERQGGFRMDVLGRMEILIGTSLDPEMTLHHEAIHAMRALNLFTAAEWEVLQQAASKGWVEKHDIDKRYPDLLPSEQIEEAIAEEFAASVKARRAPASSAITRVFNKIHRLLKAFGNALRGQGFQTAEDVFNRALSGEIGARQPFEGFREAISKDARQPVRRSAQAQAHASTSMMGQSAFIPNRGIWDELVRQNSGIWARLRGAGAAAYDHVDSARIRIQDRFLPVLRAQEAIIRQTGQALPEEQNAYLAEETFSGKVGRHLFEIDEDYTKPIIDIMAGKKGERGLDPDEVGQWLYARHAIERNDAIAQINLQMPDGGSGMSNAEAQDILTDAAAGPNAARLQEIGRLIDKLRERTLTLRENSGLITPQEASMWRNQYQFYVPLKGFADTDNSEAYLDISGVGRRFNTKGPETKRALGRQSEAFNPLQAALTQAQEVAIRAEKNVVGQALYRLAKENPSPKLWKIKTPKQKRFYNRTTGLVESRTEDPISLFMDPNEMAVKVAGKEHRVLFQDERLARSAGSVGADQMGWFMGLMSQASRWFSAVNTMLDPEFVIRNAVRDMQAAQINVRNFGKDDRNAIGKAMLKNWPKAFVGAYRGQMNKADSEWTRYYKEFEASGAKVSFWRLEQPEAAREDLKRRLNLKGGNIAQRASKFVRISTRYNPVLGFIERTNLAVDNAVRLAAYVEARKKGWAKSDAASLSKNMTVNFNRRGEWGATINALYPFANAGIQGTQILFRAMTSRRMAKYAAGLVGMGLILDLVNAQLSEEDEDGELAYDKIPDWKNQMNLTVMLGPESDNAATFWMPYGYNMFPYMGQQIGKIARGVKEPGDALADFASAAFGAFSPMGGRDFQSVITPTMLDPINEMAMNEDWLGRPIRPENPWNDYGPNAYKYFSGVSDASRRVADVANRATGGSVAESGWLDVSPEYIDHAFGFVTGGAGRFVGRTSDTVGKLLRGEADQIESRNIPFYRSVQYEAGDWLDRERYYRFRDEVKSAQDALKTYQEAGVPVPQNVRKLASLNKMVNQSDKLLRESRKRKRLIEGREDGSDDQKQRAIKRIEENSTKVYLRFNKAFLERMGPQGE